MSDTLQAPAALVLRPVGISDPRLTIERTELVAAERNGFPVVATTRRAKDGMGLAAGGAIALMLGGFTFWSMSGHRAVPADVPAPVMAHLRMTPAAPNRPAPMIAAPIPAPAPKVVAVAPLPMPGTDPLHAPVMVFDTSASDAATSSAPRTPSPAKANAGGGGLTENDLFAGRVGDAGVETASATTMSDPATTIGQGTLIPAVLETGINTDLPGYVRALVTQDVRSFDGSHVLVPRSTRLIGQYKSGLSAGQTRAYVIWTRLMRPDGVSVALASPAIGQDGETGLTGQVDGHFLKRFGSAMLLSVVSGLSAIGNASVVLSGGQSAASVAAQRDTQIPPTIRIRPGQPIRIFTARDLDFATVGA